MLALLMQYSFKEAKSSQTLLIDTSETWEHGSPVLLLNWNQIVANYKAMTDNYLFLTETALPIMTNQAEKSQF